MNIILYVILTIDVSFKVFSIKNEWISYELNKKKKIIKFMFSGIFKGD
jgi:hypothetical protein